MPGLPDQAVLGLDVAHLGVRRAQQGGQEILVAPVGGWILQRHILHQQGDPWIVDLGTAAEVVETLTAFVQQGDQIPFDGWNLACTGMELLTFAGDEHQRTVEPQIACHLQKAPTQLLQGVGVIGTLDELDGHAQFSGSAQGHHRRSTGILDLSVEDLLGGVVAQQDPDACAQLFSLEGLHQVVIGTNLVALQAIPDVRVRRNENDGHLLQHILLADLVAGHVAIHAVHFNVEQNQIRRPGDRQLQALFARVRKHGLPPGLEGLDDHTLHKRVVIDNHDPYRRHPTPQARQINMPEV
jgi:hypothetical protein